MKTAAITTEKHTHLSSTITQGIWHTKQTNENDTQENKATNVRHYILHRISDRRFDILLGRTRMLSITSDGCNTKIGNLKSNVNLYEFFRTPFLYYLYHFFMQQQNKAKLKTGKLWRTTTSKCALKSILCNSILVRANMIACEYLINWGNDWMANRSFALARINFEARFNLNKKLSEIEI